MMRNVARLRRLCVARLSGPMCVLLLLAFACASASAGATRHPSHQTTVVPAKAVKAVFEKRRLSLSRSPIPLNRRVVLYLHFPSAGGRNDFEVGVFASAEAARLYSLPLGRRSHSRVQNVVLLLSAGVKPSVRTSALAAMSELRRRFG